jgi:hypothetical protein
VPAFGATLVPFRWLLRENAYEIAKELELEVIQDREPTDPPFLARTDWVQNHDNQEILLDAFAQRCVEKESLVFFSPRGPDRTIPPCRPSKTTQCCGAATARSITCLELQEKGLNKLTYGDAKKVDFDQVGSSFPQ